MSPKDKMEPADDPVEAGIAAKAADAFAKARRRALAANQSVVVVKDGDLVRISPNGNRAVVGKVKPPAEKMAIRYETDVAIAIQWATPRD